tara:strand:- start:10219 stop:10458 length:240 start_codon:yes stop_codon:yes gene_type:complete
MNKNFRDKDNDRSKQKDNNFYAGRSNGITGYVFPYPIVNIDKSIFHKTDIEKSNLANIRNKHNNLLKSKYGVDWKKHTN